ncbi:MAG: tetratricopeptide repeat protein [Cyanobacteria bacterium CRU_2_1]|nr:tetratricopeptide repeat protein [Cyanobacteria bacterium CRU_2_1]
MHLKSLDRYTSAIGCLSILFIPLLTSAPVFSQEVAQETSPAAPTSAEVLLDVQGILEPGDPVLSSDGSLYDEYSFTGQAGQSIVIVLESVEFDPYLILMDAQGQTLGENDDVDQDNFNAALIITLPQNGTYRVLVNAYNAESQGHYTLIVRPTLAGQTQPQFSDRALRQVDANRLLRQGYQQYSASQFQETLQSFQQALAIYREIGVRFNEVALLNDIGAVYHDLGDYPQALDFYQQSLNISRETGDRETEGSTLNNIGLVYANLGDYPQALDYLQQSLSISREIGNRADEGTTLDNIGSIYNNLGNYPQALNHLQQSLSVSREIGDRTVESSILNNIGSVYANLGDYPQALDFYQQSLNIIRELGNRADEGASLISIGSVYGYLENYPQALNYFQQALRINQEVGDRDNEGTSLANIGLVYSYLGDYSQALDYLQQSLRISREIGDRAGEGTRLNNIGSIYNDLGDYPQAFNYYQQSLSISKEIGDRKQEATTLSHIGSSLADQNQPELAIVFLKQAVNQWEVIRNELQVLPTEQQESFTETVSDTYRRLADLLLQQDRVLEAQQVLDLLKIQELQEYLRDVRGNAQTAQGLDFWPPEQEIIALYDRSLQQGEDFEQFVSRVEVETQVAQLRRTAQGQNLNPEQLASLQNELQQLDQPAVILYPLILDDRLELVLVMPNGEPIRRTVNVGREQLNAALATLLPNLENRIRNAKPDAQQLYQWLIQPIEADLADAGATTILYAADGQLRYLPLGALYDGNQWLIQRFRINNITAASLLDFSSSQDKPLRVLAGAFSDTTLNYQFQIGTEDFIFSGLPYTEVEVENIAAEVPDTTQLFNTDFSRVAVESQLSEYSIIHLATHAEFVPGLPEASFILFGNGDRVTLRDIGAWRIANVDLVVLSACRTAVSGLGNGEEILGFGYQIQRTGARATIASLWYVDDASTQTLMTAFYAALGQGMSETEALRQAQIALITGDFSALGLSPETIPSDLVSHPYYWSPFILIGNGL